MMRITSFVACVLVASSVLAAEDPRDAEIRKLRAENMVLRATIRRLSEENDRLKARIKRLEKDLESARGATESVLRKRASAPRSDAAPRAPTSQGQARNKYEFTPLTSVQISPKFELDSSLSMGDWSYKAYRVSEKDTGVTHLAIELHIQIQPEGASLPPLFLNVQVKNASNRLVGTGMLFAERLGVMEKLPYYGLILLDSLDVDKISIRKGM